MEDQKGRRKLGTGNLCTGKQLAINKEVEVSVDEVYEFLTITEEGRDLLKEIANEWDITATFDLTLELFEHASRYTEEEKMLSFDLISCVEKDIFGDPSVHEWVPLMSPSKTRFIPSFIREYEQFKEASEKLGRLKDRIDVMLKKTEKDYKKVKKST